MKKNLKTYPTFLPLFSGFYGTIWEPDEDLELQFINSERESNGLEPLDFDDIDFDNWNYDEYKQGVIEEIAEWIPHNVDFIEHIEIEELVQPREYNFHNDSVNILMTVDVDIIKEYIEKYWDKFYLFIKEKYTGRDGFIPFYSNNAYDWWIESEEMTNFEGLEHQLGKVIEFILNELEEIHEGQIYEDVETRLHVKDFESEVIKVFCEHCGAPISLKYEYNKQVETDLNLLKQLGTIGGKMPEPKPFGEWVQNNKICPEFLKKLNNQL